LAVDLPIDSQHRHLVVREAALQNIREDITGRNKLILRSNDAMIQKYTYYRHYDKQVRT
jgi:hypothetical protein